MANSFAMVKAWEALKEFLYDTFKKELRVRSNELIQEKLCFFPEAKM